MKSVSIHPFSALAGAGLLGLALIASGAVQVPGNVQPILLSNGMVRVAGIPTPQQMMRVHEGQPFTVPPGKLFVVTGLGQAQLITGYAANLRFNGQIILTYNFSSGLSPFGDIPPGLAAPAGTVVSTDTPGGGTTAVTLGYLVDA
jgi:hypothetical protein